MNILDSRLLRTHIDVTTGRVDGVTPVLRRLSDLGGVFADTAAYESLLAVEDPVIYSVSTVEVARGARQLAYGLGVLYPGRVGREFYLTRGHFHAEREAAEFYFGLSGQGALLLEDEATGESILHALLPGDAVYVPGRTAHRTINTGVRPLVYLGVYPADAGHDYGALAQRNFAKVLVDCDGQPALLDRRAFLTSR